MEQLFFDETTVKIALIINLIAVISFFVLCYNVGRIKKNVELMKNISEISYLQQLNNDEDWICPSCKHTNSGDVSECEKCMYNFNMPKQNEESWD